MTATPDPITAAATEVERFCADLGGINPGLARTLAEIVAGVLGGPVSPLMRGELPLRVVDTGAGFAVRSLCGRETGTFSRSTAEAGAAIVRAARVLPVTNTQAGGAAHPMDVVKMAIHAGHCPRCQQAQAGFADTFRTAS
jgi:hypothetical protein